MRLFSLEGKLTAVLMLCSSIAVGLTLLAVGLLDEPVLAGVLVAVLMLMPAFVLSRQLAQPVAQLIRTLDWGDRQAALHVQDRVIPEPEAPQPPNVAESIDPFLAGGQARPVTLP